ncbi:MAG: hypothetical protein WKG03_00320 [Telluria sp.]
MSGQYTTSETMAWLIEWVDAYGQRHSEVFRHNCGGDYREMYGSAKVTELVPRQDVASAAEAHPIASDPIRLAADAARDSALEEAAKICDHHAERARTSPGNARASACAEGIRAMKTTDKEA